MLFFACFNCFYPLFFGIASLRVSSYHAGEFAGIPHRFASFIGDLSSGHHAISNADAALASPPTMVIWRFRRFPKSFNV